MSNKVRPTSAFWSTQRSVENDRYRAGDPYLEDEHAESERHVDALAEQFFSQDSLYPIAIDVDDEPAHAQRSASRAMHVTWVMLAVSAATLGTFLVYMRLIMPVPEELGVGGDVVLPRPITPASDEATPRSSATSIVNPEAEPSQVEGQAPSTVGPNSADEAPAPEPSSAQRALDSTHTLVATAGDAVLPAPAQLEPVHVAIGSLSHPRPEAAQKNDLVRRAYNNLNHGDPATALVLARRAVIEAPQRADAWIALGSAYDALHDREGARQAFRSCLQLAGGPYLAQCRALASD
jgi:hypothetical protein